MLIKLTAACGTTSVVVDLPEMDDGELPEVVISEQRAFVRTGAEYVEGTVLFQPLLVRDKHGDRLMEVPDEE